MFSYVLGVRHEEMSGMADDCGDGWSKITTILAYLTRGLRRRVRILDRVVE